jgi:hypothetical protein
MVAGGGGVIGVSAASSLLQEENTIQNSVAINNGLIIKVEYFRQNLAAKV